MFRNFWILGALLALAAGAPGRAQTPGAAPAETVKAEAKPWKLERGPREARSFREEWRDEQRSRDVPVRIWHPDGDGPFPVVIFSHGLGGSRDGYAHYGRHWASHGYVVVHLQHLGSDEAVWRGNPRAMEDMQRAAAELDNLLGRPKDVSFAIDELARRNERAEWPLAGKLNLGALAVAGHSFGAYTALCAAGRDLVAPGGTKLEVSDPRVKACIAMSPQGHERERGNGTWSEFSCPVFHMTGTEDQSPIRGDSTPAERRIPFDTITLAEQCLLILDGAQHMAFSDAPAGFRGRRDPEHEPLILSSSTAFLDAYLRADAAALAWLRDGGFGAWLGARGTFEVKRPAAAEAAPSAK